MSETGPKRRQQSTVRKHVDLLVGGSFIADVEIDVEGDDKKSLKLAQNIEQAVYDACQDFAGSDGLRERY